MIPFHSIHLPRRQAIAAAAMIALFGALCLCGTAAIVYGFFLFWRPGAFLSGGLILLLAGYFGAIGRTDPREPGGDW